MTVKKLIQFLCNYDCDAKVYLESITQKNSEITFVKKVDDVVVIGSNE